MVYIRNTYSDGRIEVKLVASKSRVAPIKAQTIPRLELLGALILARLVNKLKSIGAEYTTVLWSDSTTALCWIKNERVWKQYIGQRVEELHLGRDGKVRAVSVRVTSTNGSSIQRLRRPIQHVVHLDVNS